MRDVLTTPEKETDAVRDGRDLMQNDDAGIGHPACILTFGSEVAVREPWGIQILRPSANLEGAVISRCPDMEHPNYRYQGEQG